MLKCFQYMLQVTCEYHPGLHVSRKQQMGAGRPQILLLKRQETKVIQEIEKKNRASLRVASFCQIVI